MDEEEENEFAMLVRKTEKIFFKNERITFVDQEYKKKVAEEKRI